MSETLIDSKSEDFEIIEKVKNGNLDAFDHLVIKYQDRLYNIAYRTLGDFEEAKDTTQDTFIQVYTHLKEFRGESTVYYWLVTILMNLCKNILRKWQKEHRSQTVSLQAKIESDDGNIIAKEIPDPSLSVIDKIEIKEREEMVRKALDQLPLEFKTVVLLYDFDGLSYEEISKICKCPVGTVRSRLHRGRTMIKDSLKRLIQ